VSIDERNLGAVVDLDGDDDAAFTARISAHVTPTVDDVLGDPDDARWDDDAESEHPDGWCDDPHCCPAGAGGADPRPADPGDPLLGHLRAAEQSASDDDADSDDAGLDGPTAEPNADAAVAGSGQDRRPAPARFNRRVAWGMGGLAAAAAVAVLAGAVVFYSGGESGKKPAAPAASSLGDPQAVVVAAPTPSAEPSVAAGIDRPLPYAAAAADSCPAGSTSAQTMDGTDPHNAFVCVRGGVDGQVIDIDLGKTCVITAISLTSGWVGLDGSGVSQWGQHRVATLVQYILINGSERTLVTQDTHNVHGEAVQAVKRVMASKIRMLIRQTSRPPAEPSPATAAPGGGGGLASVFGTDAPSAPLVAPPAGDLFGPAASTNSDPVDATFAISTLKVIGHEPL